MMRLALLDPPPTWQQGAMSLASPASTVQIIRSAASRELPTREALLAFLATHQLDAIYLARWPQQGSEFLATILDSGRQLLFAPPLGLDRAAWASLERQLQRWLGQWTVATPHRNRPYYKAARQALASHKLGTVGALRVHAWEPPETPTGFEDNMTHPNALARCIYDEIDAACWLLNEPPLTTHTMPYRNLGCLLHLRFASGAMALLDCAHCLPAGTEPYSSVSIIGARGAFYGNDQHNVHLQLAGTWTALKAENQGVAMLTAQLDQFLTELHSPELGLRELQTARRMHELMESAIDIHHASLPKRMA